MEECCDICGSVGVPDALVTCSQCKASLQHMYCMRARFLEYPDDWCCEECGPSSKPTFSQLANCSEVSKGAARPSKIRKLLNESKRGPLNCEKKVATRKTEYISINDVIKLPSGAIDSSSSSKVTCQSSTSQPPTREEKSYFSRKNSSFDARWTSLPVHSRSTPCVSPTQDDRMSKAEMLKTRKSRKAGAQSSGISSEAPKLGPIEKKRPASPELNLERRKKGVSSITPLEVELSENFPLQPEGKGKEPVVELGDSPPTSPTPLRSQKPYNFGDSLMQQGSEPTSYFLLRNLLPEVDLPLVQQATDQEVDEKMALGLLQGSLWAAERASRASRTRELYASSGKDMDDVWTRHAALTQQLQDYADRAAVERASLEAEVKALRDRAEIAELKATRVELAEQEKDRVVVENLSLQRQVTSLQQEAQDQWPGKKEEFLKSFEFKVLCSDKALDFFEQGLQGCLDQFRANGYTEVDHPAEFLNVDKALEALPEDGEIPETKQAAEEGFEPKNV